jgi:hypothetical protein
MLRTVIVIALRPTLTRSLGAAQVFRDPIPLELSACRAHAQVSNLKHSLAMIDRAIDMPTPRQGVSHSK